MELPNYTDLGKIYEMNPGAFMEAQDQMGLARQFQNQKLQQGSADLQKTTLDNLFNEQNNPEKLNEQRFRSNKWGVESRIAEATEGLQLDAKQQEFIKSAKQSDLDMMEIQAQKWAYGLNSTPEQKQQGEKMLRMHKDFIKLREEQKFRAEEGDKTRAASLKEAQIRASSKGSGGGSSGGVTKMSTDQYRSSLLQRMEQARTMGDVDSYTYLSQQLEFVNKIKEQERPDPLAGKPNLDSAGIATNPPRQKPVVPPLPGATPSAAPKQQAKPSLPAGWTMTK